MPPVPLDQDLLIVVLLLLQLLFTLTLPLLSLVLNVQLEPALVPQLPLLLLAEMDIP